MSKEYTPSTQEILQALAFCRAYGQGGIPECPDNEVPMDAVRRGLNKIVEEAFERGFNAGYYNREDLDEDR